MVPWKVVWPEELEEAGTACSRGPESEEATACSDASRPVTRPNLRVVRDDATDAVIEFGDRTTRAQRSDFSHDADGQLRAARSPYAWAVVIRERARDIYHNRVCPACRRAAAVPLCLRDGVCDPNGRVNPFTATLVGFRCLQCDHEWPASRIHH